MIEASSIKNVDAEISNAVKTWREECLKWIHTQLSPDATAAWKNPPRANERPKVSQYHVDPFTSTNGIPEPECAASVAFNAAKGYFGNWSTVTFRQACMTPASPPC